MSEGRIPCGVIKDLLPSYIDRLTGEETDRIVEEHLSTCDECRSTFESMRAGDTVVARIDEDTAQAKEIDFLKKNRKRNNRIILASVLTLLGVALITLFLRFFVIGGYEDSDSVICRVTVDNNTVRVTGAARKEGLGISYISFEETSGVINMKVRTVPFSVFYNNEFTTGYEAGTDVKSVLFNGVVIWEENDPVYSKAMMDALFEDWEKWNSLDWMSQVESSEIPGELNRTFYMWENLKSYMGVEIINPFEDLGDEAMSNVFGEDSEGYELIKHGSHLFWKGESSGRITEARTDSSYDIKLYDSGSVMYHNDSTGTFTWKYDRSEEASIVFRSVLGGTSVSAFNQGTVVTAYAKSGLVYFRGREGVGSRYCTKISYSIDGVLYIIEIYDGESYFDESRIPDYVINLVLRAYREYKLKIK